MSHQQHPLYLADQAASKAASVEVVTGARVYHGGIKFFLGRAKIRRGKF